MATAFDDFFPSSSAANDPPRAPWADRLLSVPVAWQTTAPESRRWLLRDSRVQQASGVLPLGKVGQLVAEGGAGKTMALVQLALAVATGTTWLGTLTTPHPGRVLLVLGEEDADEVHRRVYHAAQVAGVRYPADSIVALPLSGVPAPMVTQGRHGYEDGEFLTWLREYVATGDWRMIGIDPLSRFAGLDAETDNAAATRFVQSLESLATVSQATVLAAHHTNKLSRANGAHVTTASARGASALTDGVRWVATLSSERIEDEEVVTVGFTKSNYGRKAEPIQLRRESRHGGALVPLDDDDRARIADLRAKLDPSTEAREKREERRAANDADVARRRAEVDARNEALMTERLDALRQCVEAQPGIGDLDLFYALRARVGGTLGRDYARTVIARAEYQGWMRVETGAYGKRLHYVIPTTDT